MMDAEDDPVVREIDVLLSPALASQLYLLQFPIQKDNHAPPSAVRVKPNHNTLELDFNIPHGIEEFGQYQMPNRTFISQTIPVSTHMALGKFMPVNAGVDDDSDSDNISSEGPLALHMVPLAHISQLRPSFAHVDEATANATATTEEETKRREKSEAAKLERKPLSLIKKESERAEMLRKSSYSYQKASEESELWHELEVISDPEAPEISEMMRQVACPAPHDRLLQDKKDKDNVPSDDMADEPETPLSSDEPKSSLVHNSEYVRSLNYAPVVKSKEEDKPGEIEAGESGAAVDVSSGDIKAVCTKLVKLLHKGWPVPFSLLRHQFPADVVTDDDLFLALDSCAFLVRGNFIIQSKLLPLSPELIGARTFILFLLQTKAFVHRDRLEHVYKDDPNVTIESILMLLRQVATCTASGWSLKIEDDVHFAQDYPNVVLSSLQFWGRQVGRFHPLVSAYTSDHGSDEELEQAV